MRETVRISSVWDTGHDYEVRLTKGGEVFKITHPRKVLREPDRLPFEGELKDLPFDRLELIETLRVFAKGSKENTDERKGAIDLAQILHIEIRHQFGTEPATLQTYVKMLRDLDLSTSHADQLNHIFSESARLPETPLAGESLTPIYHAYSPSTGFADAFSALRRILPKRAIEAVRVNHTSFSLLPISRHLRDFYNRHPEIRDAFLFFGFTDVNSTPPSIVLNSDNDIAESLYMLTHELGHFLKGIFEAQAGTPRGVPGNPESTFRNVISAHWKSRVEIGPNDGLGRSASPTSYGAVSIEEWFADIFAIYFLGKQSGHIEKTLAVSFERLLDEFKQKDPGGYLLMVRLDQYLSGDDRYRPEVSFSWSGAEDISIFLKNNWSDDEDELENMERLEPLWRLRPPPDMSVEREYEKIVQMWKESNKTPRKQEDYLSRLWRFCNDHPTFYPARRDFWIEMAEVKMEEGDYLDLTIYGQTLATNYSFDEIADGLTSVFKTVPNDPVLIDFFSRSAGTVFDAKNSAPLFDGEIEINGGKNRKPQLSRFTPLWQELAGQHNPTALSFLPLFLILEGRYAEAAREFNREDSFYSGNPGWELPRVTVDAALGKDDWRSLQKKMLDALEKEISSPLSPPSPFDLRAWLGFGLQRLAEWHQREGRYDDLIALLSVVLEKDFDLFVTVSRVVDRNIASRPMEKNAERARWAALQSKLKTELKKPLIWMRLEITGGLRGLCALYQIEPPEKSLLDPSEEDLKTIEDLKKLDKFIREEAKDLLEKPSPE